MTIIGITLFNTTFVNGSFLFNDFNGVFFPTNIVFAQMQYTKSNQLLSNEKALIVYSNPVNYIMANFSFIQCNFSDISSSIFS